MMYSDKFVVAVKVDGKVLRETKDLVTLPFGSEFSVLVKNLNSRRAKFTLHIDGTDVLEGTEIIVNANSEVEMKRFIRNGNMNEGNAFKFIERTAAIEDGPRGIKVDDGVVRVEFWFEQEAPKMTTTVHHHHDYWWDKHYYRTPPFGGPYYTSSTHSSISGDAANVKLGTTKSAMRSISTNSISGASLQGSPTAAYNVSSNSAVFSDAVSDANEAGITVPGSKVEQKFTNVYGFNSESISNVIVLRLAGKVGSIEVVAPITVKSVQKCTTCGHVSKQNAKFCSQCATSLELV